MLELKFPVGRAGGEDIAGIIGKSVTVTVEAITGGHRITLNDKDGPHSFDVMDGQGGEGGTSDHRQLSYRDADNQHPMSAITGLLAAIAGKQDTISDLSQIRAWAGLGSTAYQKPSGGIPKTDLASAVQTSLGKADSALQSVPSTYRTASAQDAIDAGKQDVIDKYLATVSVSGNTLSIKRNDGTTLNFTPQGGGGEGGTTDHNALSNRDLADQHPMSAIIGLIAALNAKMDADTPIPAAVTEQTVSGWGFTKNTGTYSKPSGGIPKSDLASAVQTSLGKADTALQSVPSTYRTAAAQDAIDAGKQASIDDLDTIRAGAEIANNLADWAKATNKPSYTASEVGARSSSWTPTKSQIGLGSVDNVRQYSASNPPPYPVTSVNGQTGAVTVAVVTDAHINDLIDAKLGVIENGNY